MKSQVARVRSGAEKKEADVITTRIMAFFSTACFGVLLFFILDRFAGIAANKALSGTLGAAGILLAFGGVAMNIVRKKKNTDERMKIVRGCDLMIWGAVLAMCMTFVCAGGKEFNTFVYLTFSGIGALYVLYYIYRREFFVTALTACFGAAGLYIMPKLAFQNGRLSAAAVAAALVLAMVILTVVAAQNKRDAGVLPLGGGVRMTHFDSHGTPVYIMALAALAAIAVTWFFPGYGLYCIFALAGVTLVVGIYYTVKMI